MLEKPHVLAVNGAKVRTAGFYIPHAALSRLVTLGEYVYGILG